MNPVNLGYAENLLQTSDTDIITCANGDTLMHHSAGSILGEGEPRSRFWIDWHIDLATRKPQRTLES